VAASYFLSIHNYKLLSALLTGYSLPLLSPSEGQILFLYVIRIFGLIKQTWVLVPLTLTWLFTSRDGWLYIYISSSTSFLLVLLGILLLQLLLPLLGSPPILVLLPNDKAYSTMLLQLLMEMLVQALMGMLLELVLMELLMGKSQFN